MVVKYSDAGLPIVDVTNNGLIRRQLEDAEGALREASRLADKAERGLTSAFVREKLLPGLRFLLSVYRV